MRKTIIALTAMLLLAAVFLSGCTSSSGNEGNDNRSNNSGNNGEATPIDFWTFNALHVQFYEEMAKLWNEANPDKQIIFKGEAMPYEDMHNKLLVSLQSGVGAPDIADIEISKFSNFLKGSEIPLVDLTPLLKPIYDKYVEARLLIYSKDNKVYGLPFHVGATVMYYNKDILDEAGVNVDDIKTWADFVDAGKKVTEATGKPMMTIEITDQWTFWPMISQRDSDYFDKNGDVILDNQINIETLEFLHSMIYDHQVAVPAPGGGHHAEEYYGFMNNGGAAAVLMPMWYMGRFTEYMPDLKGKIVIKPMPSWEPGGKRSAGMGGTGTVVTKQSKNVNLAQEFLVFAKGSEEGNKKIWSIMGFDPPRWDVWESEELKQQNKYTDYFGPDIFSVLTEIKDEINAVNITEKTPQAADLVRKTVMFSALQEQSQTPAEVLKTVAAELRK